MKDAIPFFYYDIIARIVPGGVVVSLLILCCGDVPSCAHADSISKLVIGSEGWKTVVVPLCILGIMWLLGAILDVFVSYDWLINLVSLRALDKYQPIYASVVVEMKKASARREKQRLLIGAWQWLAHRTTPQVGFTHAHRMQAEVKMLIHLSAIALLTFVVLLAKSVSVGCKSGNWNWHFGLLVTALVVSGFLLAVAGRREHRRWIQVLAAVDHSDHDGSYKPEKVPNSEELHGPREEKLRSWLRTIMKELWLETFSPQAEHRGQRIAKLVLSPILVFAVTIWLGRVH